VAQPDRVLLGELGDEERLFAPAGIEHEGVARLFHEREVEEIGGLAEAIVDVSVAAGGVGREEDDEAVGQALHEGAPMDAGHALLVGR
jgi:hypothetical protein